MPIHLFWGDDSAACERAIEKLIEKTIDPAWSTINLSRLDGNDNIQAGKALEEVRTPPFGNGGRVIVVQRSPFCNGCSSDLAESFEDVLELIPKNTYLILQNTNKPDGRLRTTKTLQTLIKTKKANESRFLLPTIWDGKGQREFVERTAKELGLELASEATELIIDSIGNDSARLTSELKKLAILADSKTQNNKSQQTLLFISAEIVKELIAGLSTNALKVGESLLSNNVAEALERLNALIETGEPALRILATLINQIRGWLWVSLLEQEGEKDVAIIAKAAGIANPKRIYVMRKQIQQISPDRFLNLLESLLEIETALKKGAMPLDAFKDSLLSNKSLQ